MAEEITVEEVSVSDGPPVRNDPRGSFSLLAPILDPIDTRITPEKVISGDYEVPEILLGEDVEKLPPGANFTFTDPETNEVTFNVRTDRSVPNIVEEYDGVYDGLPIGGYFYPDASRNPKSLSRKTEPEPSLFARGRGRLFGSDIDAKGFGIEIPRVVSTITGGMVGSNLGLQIPTNPTPLGVGFKAAGVLALGAIGSAVGAILPEQTLEWGEKFGLIPEGTRDEYGYTDEELRTLFVGEGILDLAFGAGFSGLRAIGRPVMNYSAGVSENAKELAKKAQDRGIAMLPVMLGDGPVARGYVAVMGRFPFFGAPFKKGGVRAVEDFNNLVNKVPSRMGPLIGLNDLSYRIFNDATNYVKNVEKDFSTKYDAIFSRAKDANVRVVPQNALEESKRIKDTILGTRTQRADGTFAPLSTASQGFVDFLDAQILSLRQGSVRTQTPPSFRRNPNTGVQETVLETVPVRLESGETLNGVPQELAQMDGMLSQLDTFMQQTRTQLNGKLPENFGNYWSTLGDSIKGDVVGNLVQPAGRNAETGLEIFKRNPEGATGQIGSDLQALDIKFSQTMQALFETSGAKMFEGITRQGLRSVTPPSRQAMRKHVDTFAETLLTTVPKSPASLLELRRIVGPETYNMIGAEYLYKVISNARNSDGVLQMSKLRDSFGLDNLNSPQAKGLEALLSGMRASPDVDDIRTILSLPELDTIVNIGETISNLDIPDVATFIARRAVFGGVASIKKSFNPFGVAAGTAAGGAGVGTLFGIVPLMITLSGLAGARGLSAMLSNPSTALPLKRVIQEEAEGLVDKQNFYRVGRGVIRSIGISTGLDNDEITAKLREFDGIYKYLKEAEEDPSVIEEPSDAVVAAEADVVAAEAALVPVPVAVAEPPPFEAMRDNVPPPPIEVAQLPQQPTPIAVPPPRPAPQGIAAAAASPESRAQYAAMFPDDLASGVIRSQGIGSLV